jgi:hypothetical protein
MHITTTVAERQLVYVQSVENFYLKQYRERKMSEIEIIRSVKMKQSILYRRCL